MKLPEFTYMSAELKRDVTLNFTSKEKNYEKKSIVRLFCCFNCCFFGRMQQRQWKKVESKKKVEKATDKSAETDDSKTGEIVEENGMKKVPVMTDKKLNMTGKTGPIKYSIDGIQISKFTATTDEMADTLEIDKNKEITLVALNVSAENTSDKTVNFYLGQAKITTDTKEQADPDVMLGENLEGEFLGKVKHNGTNIYLLKNSKADKINKIKLFVDAPSDENYESVGNKVELELKLK